MGKWLSLSRRPTLRGGGGNDPMRDDSPAAVDTEGLEAETVARLRDGVAVRQHAARAATADVDFLVHFRPGEKRALIADRPRGRRDVAALCEQNPDLDVQRVNELIAPYRGAWHPDPTA